MVELLTDKKFLLVLLSKKMVRERDMEAQLRDSLPPKILSQLQIDPTRKFFLSRLIKL